MRRVALTVMLLLVSFAAAMADTTTTGTGTTTASGSASTAQKPDLSPPKDSAEKWVVGFTVLASDGLSQENRYLAFSLPQMLRNEVSGLTRHRFSAEEVDGMRRVLLGREVTTAEQSITSARKDRDALLFADTTATSGAWKAADAKVKLVADRLDFLKGLDPSLIPLVDDKPVSFKSGDDTGRLLDAPRVGAAQYCQTQGLDFLVGGSLQEVQGYLLFDLWAYNASLGRIVFSTRDAARREDLYGEAATLGKGLAEAILGRPWAVVRFAPTPPSATLKVDGATVTAGASPAVYLAPGPHLVEITAMGYASVVRSVLLPAQEQTVIDDTLEKTITGHIGVTSEPPAADVYVGSLWVGKTPLFVDRPSTRQRGVLTLPGYYDLPFSLEPTSRDSLSFSLQKDLGKRDELQKKAREDFYTSFGWFALSLPLSLFTYGMAIDFALQSNAYGSAGNAISAAASASTYYFFQGVYYGGIAVNVALFTWMVFRIINYVSISNGSAG